MPQGGNVPHNDRIKPATGSPRICQRCGAALETALHLPERIGQPAYDIFRCLACGFVDWVAEGPQRQASAAAIDER